MSKTERRPARKRRNPLLTAGMTTVDWKDAAFLRQFISDRGKIRSRECHRADPAATAPGSHRDQERPRNGIPALSRPRVTLNSLPLLAILDLEGAAGYLRAEQLIDLDEGLVATSDIVAVGSFGNRVQVGPLDHGGLVEEYLAPWRDRGLFHDLGQGVELSDHDCWHPDAGLADLFEGVLDQPVVVGLAGDDPDRARVVVIHPLRMPTSGEPAQAFAQPVDTAQGGEGVVDRGRQRADRYLDELVATWATSRSTHP